MKLPPDYHSHTSLCKHAIGKPIDYARAAVRRGLPIMACTEHSPSPVPFDPEHRMFLHEFDQYLDWVDEARHVEGIEVLLGLEADYYEGYEGFLTDFLPRYPFDIVLGSVHYNAYEPEEGHRLEGVYNAADVEGSWTRYFDLIGRMAETGLYDVVSHLDLPKKFGPPPSAELVEALARPALARIAGAGMGIEINTSGFFHGRGEPYPSLRMLTWAREYEVPISFGSDSHDPARMGDHFEEAVELARQAGHTHRAEYRQRQRTMVAL